MRSILQVGSTGDSSARRSISSPALGTTVAVGDRRIPGVSPSHVLRSLITVLCGPQGFLCANSFWSLL